MTKPTRSWMTGIGLKTVATLLLSTLLISCGSSKKYDEFIPTRILSIGDALSYTNFTLGGDADNLVTSIAPDTGKTDHWLWKYAASYGLTNLGAAPGTGKNVVFFNTATLPASGNPSSLGRYVEVSNQVTALKNSISPQPGDLVVISIGMGDVFERADTLELTNSSTTTSDSTAKDVGLQYVNLADSLYQHGFKHVLIVNAVDYSSSQYVATLSANYKANIAALTEALNVGVNRNCNGGCTVNDDKPYPSGQGVRKYNLFDILRNIVAGRTPGVIANINNNTVNGTSTSPLCLTPTLLSACTPNSLYDASNHPYFYSGDLFLSPTFHRYIGTALYNFSRSNAGF